MEKGKTETNLPHGHGKKTGLTLTLDAMLTEDWDQYWIMEKH